LLLFLQSNLSLAGASVVVLLLMAVRAISTEKALRRDLTGSIYFLLLSILLRLAQSALAPRLTPVAMRSFEIAWMLAMAFGCIRTVVSLALFLVRLRSAPTPKILRDVIDFTLYALAAIPIVKSEFDIDVSSLIATSAALSLVLGMALQETLGNFFAGLGIQLERPFQVGDFVEIQKEKGRVVQMAWRATRIETSKREVLTFPNSILSKEMVRNFSRNGEPIASTVKIGLSYEAPPNRVKRVCMEVLSEIPQVLKDPPPTVKTDQYLDSAIQYRLKFFCESGRFFSEVEDELLTRLWYRLRRENIEIPYPQRTVQLTRNEKKAVLSGERRRELLRSVDLFTVLEPALRDSLAEDLVVRHFGKSERVIEAGAPGQTFYLVAEGAVAVMAGRPAKEVARLTMGNYFGEMSLLTGEPRSATVVAVEDALLLEFDRPTFAKLFAEHPDLAAQLSALLARRRSELKAVAAAAGAQDAAPEANRILGKLRQIFGLKQD
jgi:small-conductance mechanosensitive channel